MNLQSPRGSCVTQVLVTCRLLCLVLVGFLWSCANQTESSAFLASIASTNSERAPLTETPAQVITGRWLASDGTQINFFADGTFDMPTERMVSSGTDKSIPKGMVMVDGALNRGRMTWAYEGDKNGGILKTNVENYDRGVTGGFLIKISFVNDRKIVLDMNGKAEVFSKMYVPSSVLLGSATSGPMNALPSLGSHQFVFASENTDRIMNTRSA